MGLFDKLFGKKREDPTPKNGTDKIPHEEDWGFYFSKVDDILGSFFIDLGLATVAPMTDKPNLVWISVQMNHPREDGLSSDEEFDTLSAIEDRLEEFITGRHDAIYAGRLTTNNRRDFYFYMADTTLYDKAISESMVAFPSYAYDFGIKEDSQWASYLNFMYPSPRQLQSILNRKVIDNLEKNGDSLTKERPVDHWIFFKTEKDRIDFISRIENLHFNIIDKDIDTSDRAFKYRLHISRIDNVDLDSIDRCVLTLWEFAQECNGDYDGWETSVEKE